MKEIVIKLERDTYRGLTTLGKWIEPNGMTYETLEDCVRGWGIKDAGNTAIPTGRYKLTVSVSQRFKREMVMVYTEDNKYELKTNGISFKGIRVHGGNTNKDSWGCIIVGTRREGLERISGTKEQAVTSYVKDMIKAGFQVYLEVINKRQLQ